MWFDHRNYGYQLPGHSQISKCLIANGLTLKNHLYRLKLRKEFSYKLVSVHIFSYQSEKLSLLTVSLRSSAPSVKVKWFFKTNSTLVECATCQISSNSLQLCQQKWVFTHIFFHAYIPSVEFSNFESFMKAFDTWGAIAKSKQVLKIQFKCESDTLQAKIFLSCNNLFIFLP